MIIINTKEIITKHKEEEKFINETILPLADEVADIVKTYNLTYKQAKVLIQILLNKIETDSIFS